jgi:hypothetical protein
MVFGNCKFEFADPQFSSARHNHSVRRLRNMFNNPRCCLILFGFVASVRGGQKVIKDEIGYFAAQYLTGGEVKAEMNAGEDAALRCLLIGGRKAGE